jgi:putative component of membrane protein insertase Oxa1/YidC/SpoIIIJ protein YidD
MWLIKKMDELDALAVTIRRLADARPAAIGGLDSRREKI